jgi:predicted lipoprotein
MYFSKSIKLICISCALALLPQWAFAMSSERVPRTSTGFVSTLIPVSPSGKTQLPCRLCGETVPAFAQPDVRAVQLSYVSLAAAHYSNALGAANAMTAAISALESAPTEANLLAARTAWQAARTAYLTTSVFGFYGGPIDGSPSQPRAVAPGLRIATALGRVEHALWATPDNPKAALRKWLVDAAGAGAACTALQADLTQVLKEWDVIRRTGYAQKFLALDGAEAIQKMLHGMAMQSRQLANTSDAWEKHANVIHASLSGIDSIWHAKLNSISVDSVEALVIKIDPQAATVVNQALRAAQIAAGAPDTETIPGADRAKQKALLRTLAGAIVNAGRVLGVDLGLG